MKHILSLHQVLIPDRKEISKLFPDEEIHWISFEKGIRMYFKEIYADKQLQNMEWNLCSISHIFDLAAEEWSATNCKLVLPFGRRELHFEVIKIANYHGIGTLIPTGHGWPYSFGEVLFTFP